MPTWATAQNACKNPVYLTLDTGHMDVAPMMADVLRRQQVKVTFFVANERTKTGDGSLGNAWGTWWKSVAAQGHEFASHRDLPFAKTAQHTDALRTRQFGGK